ncbi:bifunctional UDP-N-acetylglucosamine diphosphorylase/glucosamine-1-phosphate N-acetyltransferase GlmU [Halobacteriovorax sp. JY17]|uniref:bifunctional UDP-N-acetylglucosamine diphosphorylase/glucosamine-1-phosphate N-acetyltransferase GlmU n=1 Tax=Halobacteriovorax sp. JY17 TaxID=2014617 RepID=UPI000C5644A9|nr:bifunctional UDP-N-acetylglucosamine diphosphorylase/glucosamine-1-phosphate N-acetyltransferase GlmU [Halobacteriovorax sp. JY17]PIK14537.1 MAG: UDP-N-acetylglucosamine diphosphorylase/glucosamine-1-phosphate N-acetyltransferase [Halobacteriovorax sp. JY17]
MKYEVGTVILSAGAGTRMSLSLPKPLAPFLGKSLVDYPLSESLKMMSSIADSKSFTGLVTGHGKELVEEYVNKNYGNHQISYAYQKEQLGTAHALRCYFDQIEDAKECEYTLVMCADTPLIESESLISLYREAKDKNLDGVAATFKVATPKGYGRIIRSKNSGFHIVEEKDANDVERQVQEVNSGMYVLKTSFILEHLYSIGSSNKAGEFYLTDLFKDEYNVSPILFESASSFVGVNNLEQLEKAEIAMRKRIISSLRETGVRFVDSRHTYINTSNIGKGSFIHPNVSIDNLSRVGENVTLEPGCIIVNSTIEDGVTVKAYSHLEEVILRKSSVVGPYARLRPGADIGEEAKIGNFVEVKKSKLEKGVKVSHLSYVGDAEIGEETNIGCGFITCNYDGAKKHKTIIGKRSFIGSDSQTVAPVTIGDDCFVASASTITHDMKDGSFAISRPKQATKEGMAKRFLKSK